MEPTTPDDLKGDYSNEEFWASMKELRESQKETTRRMEEDGFFRKFGKMDEIRVAPKIMKRFRELGHRFDFAAYSKYGPYGGLKIFDENGSESEISILLGDDNYVIAVDVKTEPDKQDIEDHIKRLEILREAKCHSVNKRKIRGAMAGAVFPEDVKEAAIKAGFYVLVQSGNTMKIDIPQNFVPREW